MPRLRSLILIMSVNDESIRLNRIIWKDLEAKIRKAKEEAIAEEKQALEEEKRYERKLYLEQKEKESTAKQANTPTCRRTNAQTHDHADKCS